MSYRTEICKFQDCMLDACSDGYCTSHSIKRTLDRYTQARVEVLYKENPWLKVHIDRLEDRIHDLEYELWQLKGSK